VHEVCVRLSGGNARGVRRVRRSLDPRKRGLVFCEWTRDDVAIPALVSESTVGQTERVSNGRTERNKKANVESHDVTVVEVRRDT